MRLEAWHWVVIGAILAVAEIFMPSAILIWCGVAAIVLGVALWILPPIGWEWQIGAFIVLAPIAVALGLQLRRRWAKPDARPEVNIGANRLVGQRGILQTSIVAGRGSAKLGDTVWPVTGPDLPAGTHVTVTATDGVTLTVAA
jgi:membrane protein implicated in regulation of membrane protease activity